jgi:hypothetical protein
VNGKEYNYGQYENSQFGEIFDKSGTSTAECKYTAKVSEIFKRTIIYINNGEDVQFYDNNELKEDRSAEGEIQNKKLTIGGTEWNYGISLNGSIYTLRFYNRALTEKEIEQNYNIDKIRYNISE